MARRILSSKDVIKALKSAKTQLTSLDDLSLNLHKLPEQHLTEAFNVFYYHLRKPIEELDLRNGKDYMFIYRALLGLAALRSEYFKQNDPQLLKIWPEAFKWMKAILQSRYYHGFDTGFFRCADQVFNTTSSANLDLMMDDNVLELAMELYRGHGSGKADRYTTGPLLCCMTVKSLNEKQVDYMYKYFDCDEASIVRKLLRRFSAAARSNPKDTTATTDLSDLLRRLESFHNNPISHAIGVPKSKAIRVAITVMRILLDDPQQTPEHGFSVRFSLDFLLQLVPTRIVHVHHAIKCEVIDVVLKVAAKPEYGCKEKPVYLVKELGLGLVLKDITNSATLSMGNLTREKFDLPKLLRSASPSFQAEWKKFSSLLLEQAVIFGLFELGYSTELGSCASCRQISDRKEFKKCSGCEVVLYCSKSCQKKDRPRHQKRCDEVGFEAMTNFLLNGSRGSRRLATLQINRYWHHIVAFAKEQEIPLNFLGVYISYNDVPFTIRVFDSRETDDLDLETEPDFIPSLIANEVLRRRIVNETPPSCLLTINHVGTVEVSYMVYLENNLNAHVKKATRVQGVACADEKGNDLYPSESDIVEDIISKTLASSGSDWRVLWRERTFESVTEKTLGELKSSTTT